MRALVGPRTRAASICAQARSTSITYGRRRALSAARSDAGRHAGRRPAASIANARPVWHRNSLHSSGPTHGRRSRPTCGSPSTVRCAAGSPAGRARAGALAAGHDRSAAAGHRPLRPARRARRPGGRVPCAAAAQPRKRDRLLIVDRRLSLADRLGAREATGRPRLVKVRGGATCELPVRAPRQVRGSPWVHPDAEPRRAL